jgi:hypothetical protein
MNGPLIWVIKVMNPLLMNVDVKPRSNMDLNISRRVGNVLLIFKKRIQLKGHPFRELFL